MIEKNWAKTKSTNTAKKPLPCLPYKLSYTLYYCEIPLIIKKTL